MLKVLMAAGDTFRAAASEQLEVWAERTGSEIVVGEGLKPRPATGKLIAEVTSCFRICCSTGYSIKGFLFQFC
jgi:hypothetical protein